MALAIKTQHKSIKPLIVLFYQPNKPWIYYMEDNWMEDEEDIEDELGDEVSIEDDVKEDIKSSDDKTIEELLRLKLSDVALVDLMVTHAKNKSASVARPYLFWIAEQYGANQAPRKIESSFEGAEKLKEDEWEKEIEEFNKET